MVGCVVDAIFEKINKDLSLQKRHGGKEAYQQLTGSYTDHNAADQAYLSRPHDTDSRGGMANYEQNLVESDTTKLSLNSC